MKNSILHQQTLKPSILGRLLGEKGFDLEYTTEGLLLSINGTQSLVIESSLGIKKGVFFASLGLASESGKVKCGFVNKVQARELEVFVNSCFHKNKSDQFIKLQADIEQQLLNQYPREKVLSDQQEQFTEVLPYLDQELDVSIVGEEHLLALAALSSYVSQSENCLAEIREKFITQELNEYRSFFDSVESQPLTEAQRKACIIDEENNLVLAGAGTGKTSVMIARAAYLLKKNLVDKNHLLMLAYGDKAAKEMKERAKDKLKGLNLDISTFHSLGQKIVAQVEGYKPSLSIMATDEKARLKFICSQLHEHMRHNEEYQEKAFQYFNYHLAEFIDPFRYEPRAIT